MHIIWPKNHRLKRGTFDLKLFLVENEKCMQQGADKKG